MSKTEKQKLLDMLEQSHSALLDMIVNADLEAIIHQDSGWRVRDILGHIGSWDWIMAKALSEFLNGREYIMPDYDEERFNDEAVKKQQIMSTEEVVEDWKNARKELIGVLEMIPSDRFPGDFVYPWGDERGSIYDFIIYFYDHDIEHKDEIEKFIKAQE